MASRPYKANWRDRIAVAMCNVILRTLATKHYRDFVKGSILYGLRAAARDSEASVDQPLSTSKDGP